MMIDIYIQGENCGGVPKKCVYVRETLCNDRDPKLAEKTYQAGLAIAQKGEKQADHFSTRSLNDW